jgi:hypothetical protein
VGQLGQHGLAGHRHDPGVLVINREPPNIPMSSPIIQLSVIRALRHSTGLNDGTALEMASMPVIAVAPAANAHADGQRVRQAGQAGQDQDGQHRLGPVGDRGQRVRRQHR